MRGIGNQEVEQAIAGGFVRIKSRVHRIYQISSLLASMLCENYVETGWRGCPKSPHCHAERSEVPPCRGYRATRCGIPTYKTFGRDIHFADRISGFVAKGESASGMTSVVRPQYEGADSFRMTFPFFLDNLIKVRVILNRATTIQEFNFHSNMIITPLPPNCETID